MDKGKSYTWLGHDTDREKFWKKIQAAVAGGDTTNFTKFELYLVDLVGRSNIANAEFNKELIEKKLMVQLPLKDAYGYATEDYISNKSLINESQNEFLLSKNLRYIGFYDKNSIDKQYFDNFNTAKKSEIFSKAHREKIIGEVWTSLLGNINHHLKKSVKKDILPILEDIYTKCPRCFIRYDLIADDIRALRNADLSTQQAFLNSLQAEANAAKEYMMYTMEYPGASAEKKNDTEKNLSAIIKTIETTRSGYFPALEKAIGPNPTVNQRIAEHKKYSKYIDVLPEPMTNDGARKLEENYQKVFSGLLEQLKKIGIINRTMPYIISQLITSLVNRFYKAVGSNSRLVLNTQLLIDDAALVSKQTKDEKLEDKVAMYSILLNVYSLQLADELVDLTKLGIIDTKGNVVDFEHVLPDEKNNQNTYPANRRDR